MNRTAPSQTHVLVVVHHGRVVIHSRNSTQPHFLSQVKTKEGDNSTVAQPDWLTDIIKKCNHSKPVKPTNPSAPRVYKKRYRGKKKPVPGCGCLQCRKIKEKIAAGRGDPMENAGEVQHGALEKGWAMGTHGGENRSRLFGHLRDVDVADREEREAYGKPLNATYRTALGPTPKCRAGDIKTAKSFLHNIQQVIDEGEDDRDMYSTSEWARLYRMRKQWQLRANGLDPRFMVVGNIGGTPQSPQRADIKLRQQLADILEMARGKKG